MTATLDPVINGFYQEILKYAGLEYDSDKNVVINKDSKYGDFSVQGKRVTLPFPANLRHPDGKSIFHPLNENFLNPESPLFLLYKKRLVCELNVRLSCLIVSIINVAVSLDLQNKLTDSKMINLISSIKSADMTMIDNFMTAISKSKLKNDEAFIFDIFLKKNGDVKGTPYSATGKIVFNMPKAVKASLGMDTKDNHLFGAKLRLVDLNALNTIFTFLFGDENNFNEFVEGTDNKVFRYLNVLLTTSYMVSSVINDTATLLKAVDDGTLGMNEAMVSLDWLPMMEPVYQRTDEIRKIPNQDEVTVNNDDSKRGVNRASINERAVINAETFQPPPVQQPPQPVYPVQHQQVPQPQMPAQPALSFDEILRMKAAGGGMQQTPMQYQQPMQPQQYQPSPMDAWQYQEYMRQQAMMNQAPMRPQVPMWMAGPQQMQMPQQQMPAFVDPQQAYNMPLYPSNGVMYGR